MNLNKTNSQALLFIRGSRQTQAVLRRKAVPMSNLKTPSFVIVNTPFLNDWITAKSSCKPHE
jgi:hypothetical protein